MDRFAQDKFMLEMRGTQMHSDAYRAAPPPEAEI